MMIASATYLFMKFKIGFGGRRSDTIPPHKIQIGEYLLYYMSQHRSIYQGLLLIFFSEALTLLQLVQKKCFIEYESIICFSG